MKKIFNLNIKLIVLLIVFTILQTLCFSIDSKIVKDLIYLQKVDLQNEVKKLENQLAENNNYYVVIPKLGIAYHILAAKYEQKVSGNNEQYLTQSLKIKKNPIVQAYFGAAYIFKGKKALSPLSKKKYIKD